MPEWRGFNFQTGEIEGLVDSLYKNKNARADIDSLNDFKFFNHELAKRDIFYIKERGFDYKALDLGKNPDFYGRAYYSSPKGEVSIDFFWPDFKLEDYAEVFWG